MKMTTIAAAVVTIIVVVTVTIWAGAPKNYEDCVLKNMKSANSDRSASIVAATCRAKFPLPPNPFEQFVQPSN